MKNRSHCTTASAVAFLLIATVSIPVFSQQTDDNYRLTATNGQRKKIFKPNGRVLVRTGLMKAKGYLKAKGTDSVYVFLERNNEASFSTIAVADITNVRRLYTNQRLIITGAFLAGTALLFGNIQKIAPRNLGSGERNEDFTDAMIGTGIGMMFFSTLAMPVSFIVEKGNEKQKSKGWTFALEKSIVDALTP